MKIICNFCDISCDEKFIFIKHLKKEHLLKEGVDTLKCPFNNCDLEYLTFRSLNRHIDSCPHSHQNENQDATNNISELVDQIGILNVSSTEDSRLYDLPKVDDQSVACATSNFYVDSVVPVDIEENVSDEFEYKVNKSTKNICIFLKKFSANINRLELTNPKTNALYKISQELVGNLSLFYKEFLEYHPDTPINEALQVSTNFVLNEVKKMDSNYKRNKFVEAQSNYVKPEEICIGAKWKKSVQDNVPIMKQVRSTYQSVSILQKLKTTFANPNTRKIYFEHQKLRQTRCINETLKEFCCGQMFKKNQLFKDFPDSLQIQIFTDGFEVCNPLKSKVNKHSQIAVYFSILNMPSESSYNLDNIHLVALCNSSILKSSDINYNDIWEKIVQEISVLETEGVILDDGYILKGEYLN